MKNVQFSKNKNTGEQMEKFKSKISLISMMFLWAILLLAGCGNPYRNMKLEIDSKIAVENGQYTFDVDLENDEPTPFTFSVNVAGAKKGVNTNVIVSSSQTEYVTVDQTVVNGSNTDVRLTAYRVGQSLITVKSVEGNLTETIVVRVNKPVEDIVVDTTSLYIERGVAIDMREVVSYLPTDTNRKDLILQVGQVDIPAEENQILIDGNMLTVDQNSTVQSFELSIRSLYNEDIESKQITIHVVDVIQNDAIVIKYEKEGEFVELEKNNNGQYVLSMAQNSENIGDFSKNIAFFVRTPEEDILLDPATYQLGIINQQGVFTDHYTDSYVDVTKMDTTFQIMEQGMGSTVLTFGYQHKLLDTNSIKKVTLQVLVEYYPESIVVTNQNVQLDENHGMTIFDEDRPYGDGSNAIRVSIRTLNDTVLTRSPFYIHLEGEQIADYKVSLYNRNGIVDPTAMYTEQDGPFYIVHNYPSDVEIGTFSLVITSAVSGVDLTKTIPLQFVRGQMDIATNQSIYYLNVDGTAEDGTNIQNITFTGINATELWESFQIIGMQDSLVTWEWLADHSGLLLTANLEGRTGKFDVRFVAPNGNVCVATIVVFHELQDASLYVGNAVPSNIAIASVETVTEDVIANAPTYQFLSGTQVPLNFILNGTVQSLFEGTRVQVQLSGRGVTFRADNQSFTVTSSAVETVVTLTLQGYDNTGQSYATVKYFVFKVSPVLPITQVTIDQPTGSSSFQIYSRYELDSLEDDTLKKATIRYRVYPTTVKYMDPTWEVFGTQGNTIAQLTYNENEQSSTSSVQISYTLGQNNEKLYKTYAIRYGDHTIFVELNLKDKSYAVVYANIINADIVTFHIRVKLMQEYQDTNMVTTYLYNEEAYATIQVQKPTKVESIRFENLQKENDEYVYYFDIRDMQLNGNQFVGNNTASIRTNIYPIDSVNTNLVIETKVWESVDQGRTYQDTGSSAIAYLNYTVQNVDGKNYQKDLQIELLQLLNQEGDDGYITRYIEVIIYAQDSKNGSSYTIRNQFKIFLLDGSESNPFRVRTAEDVDDMRNGLNSHYVLTNNIDLSYYIATRMNGSWSPIGDKNTPFTGSLRSQNTDEFYGKYTISGLSFVENSNTNNMLVNDVENHKEYFIGLFGYLGDGASLRSFDVVVKQFDVVQTKGTVGDMLYFGVLAGATAKNTTIAGVGVYDNRGATVNPTGNGVQFVSTSSITAYIGGMVGFNQGRMTSATDTTHGVEYRLQVNLVMSVLDNSTTGASTVVYVGGMVGANSGTIQNSENNTLLFGVDTYDVVVDINPTNNQVSNRNSVFGGVAGKNTGTIQQLQVLAHIKAYNQVGGAVGSQESGVLHSLTVAPYIRGNESIGGLIGVISGYSSIDDTHIEFYGYQYANSIENSSIVGKDKVGGLIGTTTTRSSFTIKNTSIYSYTKATVEDYLPTATSAFWGDVVAQNTDAYLSLGIGYQGSSNAQNIVVTWNNIFVSASMQNFASTNSHALLPNGAMVVYNTSLHVTIPTEIDSIETFAFGTAVTNSYAVINESFVGYDTTTSYTNYQEFLTQMSTMIYTFDQAKGNAEKGLNFDSQDPTYTQAQKTQYENAVFYAHEDYTITIGDVTYPYLINLAGTDDRGTPYVTDLTTQTLQLVGSVQLLVNLPPLGVTCEAKVTVVGMVRLADSNYDQNGNLIGDVDGSLTRALEEENLKPLEEILSITAIPAFLTNSKVQVVANNRKVAEIVSYNGASYLKLNGIGEVTLTITSLYDSTITASATLQVIDQVLGFGLYEDDAYADSIVLSNDDAFQSQSTLTMEKGTTLSIYSKMMQDWNGYQQTMDSSSIGVRYRITAIENEKHEDVAIDEQYLTINGKTGTMWESALGQMTMKGLQSGTVTLEACPYYRSGDTTIYYEEYAVQFDLDIINGTQDVFVEGQTTSIRFEPSNTTQRFAVSIETDKDNEQLVLLLTDSYNMHYTFVLDTKNWKQQNTIQLGYMLLSCEFSKNDNIMTFAFYVRADMSKLYQQIDEIGETQVLDSLNTAVSVQFDFYVLGQESIDILPQATSTTDNKYTLDKTGFFQISTASRSEVISKANSNVINYPNLIITMNTEELKHGAMNAYHYPNNLEKQIEATTEETKEESYVFNGEEIPYDTILSGKNGLLKIDYTPIYANVDYVEITSTAINGQYIRFDQMIKTYTLSTVGDTSTINIQYVRDSESADPIENGITLGKRSFAYNGKTMFNGSFYVRTTIPSSIQAGNVYTITIRAYKYLPTGESVLVDTMTKQLDVLMPPSVSISCSTQAIARGMTQNFTLKINGQDDTTTLSFEQSTLKKGNVSYSYGNYFTIQSMGNDQYQVWVSSAVPQGAELNIVYKVSKRINGVNIEETNLQQPLTLTVADFVVNAIGVENVYNGRFVGLLNQFYTLRIVLTDVTYNSRTLGVAQAITNLENTLSTLAYTTQNTTLTSTWWTQEGNDLTQIKTQSYAGFIASTSKQEDNSVSIRVKNTVLTTNTLLKARTYLYYGDNGIVAVPYNQIGLPAYNGLCQNLEYDFTFDCYQYTDEENPTPIYNEEQFIDMVDNGVGDYRLMADLTLSNWTPRNTYHSTSDAVSGQTVTGVISSFDGNGYVIKIESFNTQAIQETGIAGLFATVHEDTLLKNITVLLEPTGDAQRVEVDQEGNGLASSENSVDEFDIEIDLTGNDTVYYGTIAGINNGMITNCAVTYNTEAYQDQRINELLQGTEVSPINVLSFEEYELYTTVGDQLKDTDGNYRFYQAVEKVSNFHNTIYDTVIQNNNVIKNGRTLTSIWIESDLGISAYVGGLVGQNNGYITNSRVEHISIKGSGYVAGLVAENTNKISSSYYKDGNIKNNFNSTTNAGTGGLVAINSGYIGYSYVEGRNPYQMMIGQELEGDFETVANRSVTSVDLTKFTGDNYESLLELGMYAVSMRNTYSAINTNTHAGGFVYDNTGTITNSYANILVNSTGDSAGFVYQNGENGSISEVYSLSSVAINKRNASQFSGRTTSGNWLNQGTIEHSVYLKVEGLDNKGGTIEDQVTDDPFVDAISMTQFGRYSSFTGFAFNGDYQENTAEKVASAVWFIPEMNEYDNCFSEDATENTEDLYFSIMQNNYYFPARPQLVSANILTRSVSYLAGSKTDEENNVIYSYQNVADAEGSITNPYLVYDAQLFDTRMHDVQTLRQENTLNTQEGNNTYNIRLIRDFSYADKLDRKATTYDVLFSGILDGNGMEVQDLTITAAKDSDTTADIVQAGWFGSIDQGTVKNLFIEVEEVSATGVPFVGVLSGVIHDANVFNVTITPANEDSYISGSNIIGGLAGLIYGKSQIIGITSNVNITSYFKSGSNEFNFENLYGDKGTFAILNINETKDDFSDRYTNYNKVSYVGGIVGVMDAELNEIDAYSVAQAQTSQARRLSVGDTIQLAGEIVGGIMGYMGKNVVSVNDEIQLSEDATMSIIASRVAGGIIGENHGSLQRSFVSHITTLQNSIDEAQKLGTYDTNNYRNLFGTDQDGKGTSRNAHYIGGLVGLNINGVIENSYNKVPVYSLNALASGGLIGLSFGGSIVSSYTTATVRSYESAGGLIGRMGEWYTTTAEDVTTVDSEKIQSTYYIKLPASYYTMVDLPTIFDGGVAATVWNTEDLHAKLRANGTLNTYYYLGAYVGKLDSPISNLENNDASIMGTSSYSRAKQEVNYATKVVLDYKTNIGTDASMILTETGSGNLVKATDGTYVPYITGGVYLQNPTNGKETYYLYRDMGYFCSLRTQEEIIARRLLWENDTVTWNGKIFAGTEDPIVDNGQFKHADKLKSSTTSIYNSFMEMYWNGFDINDVTLDPIDESYLYPALKAETYDLIVYVTTVEDLKKMDVYPDATFILMNDIDLGDEPWVPLCQDTPFNGTLRSNEGNVYTIHNLYFTADSIGMTQSNPINSNIGLIAQAKRAKFENFNLTLKDTNITEDNAVSVNAGYGLNYGNLVGVVVDNKKTTTFTNIQIGAEQENNVSLTLKNINTYGGVVGAGTNFTLSKVTVGPYQVGSISHSGISATIQSLVKDTQFGNNAQQHGIGGLIGLYIQEGYEPLSLLSTAVSHHTWDIATSDEGKNHTSIAMGGAIGSIVDYNLTTTSATYQLDVSVSNISIKDNSTQENNQYAMGGVIGSLTGNTTLNTSEDTSITTWQIDAITLENVNTSTNTTSYIGGLVGYQSTHNSANSNDIVYKIPSYTKDNDITMNVLGTSVGGLFGYLSGASIISSSDAVTTIPENFMNITIKGKIGDLGILAGTFVNAQDIQNISITPQTFNYAGLYQITNFGTVAGSMTGGTIDGVTVQDYQKALVENQETNQRLSINTLGGIVGNSNGTMIQNCSVTDDANKRVDANKRIYANTHGGIAGQSVLSGSTWSNLQVNIAGLSGNIAGGIVGKVDNTIQETSQLNTRTTGSISQVLTKGNIYQYYASADTISWYTNGYMGGIIGHLSASITLDQAVSEMNLILDRTSKYVGGLVGYNAGSITNSYSQGYLDISESSKGNESATENNPVYLGGLVGYNAGSIEDTYTISRYVYGSNVTMYYDTTKGGLVGDMATNASISRSYYSTDITPYSNDWGKGLYLDEILGKSFTETTSIENTLWASDGITDTTPQLAWTKDKNITTSIISSSAATTDTISNIVYDVDGSITVQAVGKTGFIIAPSVTVGGNNDGMIFGGKNKGTSLSITGDQNGIVDYFVVYSEEFIIDGNQKGLLNRVSYTGSNNIADTLGGILRNVEIFTTSNLDSILTNQVTWIDSIVAQQDVDNATVTNMTFYRTKSKTVISHNPADYVDLGGSTDLWIMIRTSNQKVEDNDTTRRKLNYGFPVLRWSLQDSYTMATTDQLSDKYYWKSNDDLVTDLQSNTWNTYDIDLGNKLWTPLATTTTTQLSGNLQGVADQGVSTTMLDTFGKNYTADRGQTLNRIYNMTIYYQNKMMAETDMTNLTNIGLFQTLPSVSNIRMENALIFVPDGTGTALNVGTVAGKVTSSATRLASVNSSIYVGNDQSTVGGLIGSMEDSGTITMAYTIYTEHGMNVSENTQDTYTYTSGISTKSTKGEIVGKGNGSQLYTPLSSTGNKLSGGGTISSAYYKEDQLKTSVLEGFNWNIWQRQNNAEHYYNLPYIDGDYPYWIDGVRKVDNAYYYNENNTGITTSTEAYTVHTSQQLAVIAYITNVEQRNVNVTLGANIDLGGKLWTPIGIESNAYQGTFDGGSHTISNMVITRVHATKDDQDYAGLFGYMSGATIKNVNIENSNIFFTDSAKIVDTVGSISGYTTNSSITNVHVNNVVLYVNGQTVGGLVGSANATTISRSSVTGSTMSANDIMGGLIGESNGGTVETSYITGSTMTQVASSVTGSTSSTQVAYLSSLSNTNATTRSNVASPYQGGLIGISTNTNILEVVADTTKISNHADSYKNVGELFGSITVSNDTPTMTNGVHNVLAYDVTNGTNNPIEKLFGNDLTYHNNMSMIFTNRKTDLDTTYYIGGLPNIEDAIMTNNPWWNGRINDNNRTANIDRPYYVPGNATNNTDITLADFMATMSLRYYPNGSIPTTKYTITQVGSSYTTIYYDDFTIQKSAGTTYYPIANTSLYGPGKDSYYQLEIATNGISYLFETMTNITEFKNFNISTDVPIANSIDNSKIGDKVSSEFSNLVLTSSAQGGALAVEYKGNGTLYSSIGKEDAFITVNANEISGGGLCDYIKNATVQYVTITGSIVGAFNQEAVGGVVGKMVSGEISNVTVTATVDGNGAPQVGGVIGDADQSSIYDTTIAMTKICNAENNLGGFVGYMSGGEITGSILASSLTLSFTQAYYVGGYVGFGSNINNIEGISLQEGVTIKIEGTANYVGGAIGYLQNSTVSIQQITVNSILLQENIHSVQGVGGLIGYVSGGNLTIQAITRTGDIIFEESSNIGGLIGSFKGNSINWTGDSANNTHIIIKDRIIGDNNIGGLIGYSSQNIDLPLGMSIDVEIHGRTENTSLYIGNQGVKHDNNLYYQVVYHDKDEYDYAIIQTEQYSYFFKPDGTDATINTGFTYETLGSTVNGKGSYWGYFNFVEPDSTDWVRHDNGYHSVELRRYSLGTVRFYATDNGYYLDDDNGRESWYENTIQSQYGASQCQDITVISSITYNWGMFYQYGISIVTSLTDIIDNVTYNKLERNNALKTYRSYSSYRADDTKKTYTLSYVTYNEDTGSSDGEWYYSATSRQYYFMGVRQLAKVINTENSQILYVDDIYGAGIDSFVPAINSMAYEINGKAYFLRQLSYLNDQSTITAGQSYTYVFANAETYSATNDKHDLIIPLKLQRGYSDIMGNYTYYGTPTDKDYVAWLSNGVSVANDMGTNENGLALVNHKVAFKCLGISWANAYKVSFVVRNSFDDVEKLNTSDPINDKLGKEDPITNLSKMEIQYIQAKNWNLNYIAGDSNYPSIAFLFIEYSA